MAACDTDNHVLLFKHSVVDAQQSANAEEAYTINEVGATVVLYYPILLARSECLQDTVYFGTAPPVLLSPTTTNHARPVFIAAEEKRELRILYCTIYVGCS